jgi:hypothetical protein
MVKHSFKVGDKVRLKDHINFRCKGMVLTIIKEAGDDFSKYIHVTYNGVRGSYFPLESNEIEYAIRIGEQLVFNFMKG